MKHKHISQISAFFIASLCISSFCFNFTCFRIGGTAIAQTLPLNLERIEIPSSFNPVGSGARALGVGGAFIAVADDATAASWNPGGLIQLGRPEISVVGAFFHRTEDNDFGTNPEASGDQRVDGKNLNYLSYSHPFTLFRRNMILSLSYQHLFDFTREWAFPITERTDQTSVVRNFRHTQEGSLSALGLAYCIQMTPKVSFGFTLNFWRDWLGNNEWEQTTHDTIEGIHHGLNDMFVSEFSTRIRYSFSGFNVNMGFLWNISEKLTLGAVFKSPFTADSDYESEFSSSLRYTESSISDFNSDTISETRTLDMPMSYGIGMAYRFSDRLTLSADIHRTEWGDFVLEDSEGNRICPISDRPFDESDIDPVHQFRIGAEYLYFNPAKSKYVIPFRGGLFYDPAPAEGSPDDFYGFSLGTGIVMGKFVFDLAYQYRFGKDTGSHILPGLKFSQDIREHTLYSSLIVHF